MPPSPLAPAPSARIEWIDLAKGICIFLVVFHHVVIVPYAAFIDATGAGGRTLSRLWFTLDTALTPLRVPLFFAISGFLAHRAVFHKPWSASAGNRLGTLLWLYALWAVLHWGSSHFIYAIAGCTPMPPAAINTIYAETPGEFLHLLVTAASSVWYLYALAIYLVVARAFRRYPGLLVAGAVIVHLLIANGLPATEWGVASVLRNGVFFMLGCHWGPRCLSWAAALRPRTAVALAVFFLGGSLAGSRGLNFGGVTGLVVSLLSILVLVRICAALTLLHSWPSLRWLGRNTLQVYVLHRPLIDVLLLAVTPALAAGLAVAGGGSLATDLSILAFPPAVALLTVAGSLLVWSGTNRGIGRRLYRLTTRPRGDRPLRPALERPS